MFTGIVQKTSDVTSVRRKTQSLELKVRLAELAGEVRIGDSIMIDGVCLTATSTSGEVVSFDVATGTAALTTLNGLEPGRYVNVELAMQPTDRFGGHFVSGHVDGTGEVMRADRKRGEIKMRIKAAPELTDQMIPKGSVAVNGVSLTIAELGHGWFELNLIPHTIHVTTLDSATAGDLVNIECDMIGKWVMRLTETGNSENMDEIADSFTLEKLKRTLGSPLE